MFRRLTDRVARSFGYDAIEEKTHRRTRTRVTQSEDKELDASSRRKLISTAHDARRNIEVGAWAIRRHLDFVSSFQFRSSTGNAEWDDACDEFIKTASKRENFDSSGRHSLRKSLRLSEALRTVAGDIGWVKINDGTTQMIEGDRIRNKLGMMPEGEWIHGVKVNARGRPVAYAIHKRKGTGFEFERTVPASRFYLHGYFDRVDQHRGISPLASALNRFNDAYEGIDYALAKAKVVQLFGLAIYKRLADPYDDGDLDEDADEDEDPAETDFKLEPEKGPFTLHMDKDEKAEFLHSNQPGSSFIEFMQVVVGIALKSLDIPYSFFDEAHTNFFGSKAALTIYLKACDEKREDNRDLLNHWTRWRVGMAIARGELDPARYGLTFDDIDGQWLWIARGVPWFDKSREIDGDIKAVENCFQDYDEIIQERTGRTLKDVVDRIAEQQEYMREKGVTPGAKPLLDLSQFMGGGKNDDEDE
ncbi:phage portal protein [Stratiformator vulcanicus]|uniref:Phage portal protein, lambda family n=1 Tax=Stratiformator vulcanicus TaxID=2527980 RepID=A0A517R7D1_9PLAN|nr:phage portal protein [Stratiformator vulcanicus]QDT39733.1 Phage portal protein, lambda family [Stratiformator vulcanicus]